jgi:hypothetical protein
MTNESEAVRAGGAHRSDAPYHSAPLVGRAVLCAPIRVTKAARTHSTSLRASCDAPYLSRQTRDERVQEALDFLGIV